MAKRQPKNALSMRIPQPDIQRTPSINRILIWSLGPAPRQGQEGPNRSHSVWGGRGGASEEVQPPLPPPAPWLTPAQAAYGKTRATRASTRLPRTHAQTNCDGSPNHRTIWFKEFPSFLRFQNFQPSKTSKFNPDISSRRESALYHRRGLRLLHHDASLASSIHKGEKTTRIF